MNHNHDDLIGFLNLQFSNLKTDVSDLRKEMQQEFRDMKAAVKEDYHSLDHRMTKVELFQVRLVGIVVGFQMALTAGVWGLLQFWK